MKSSITDLLDADGEQPQLHAAPRPVARRHRGRRRPPRAAHRAERVLAGLRTHLAARRGRPRVVVRRVGRTTRSPAPRRPSTTRSTGGATLYRAALAEANEQNKLALSTTASRYDRTSAERRRADARNQLRLLRNDDSEVGATDFYTYRYLASEGFLPGYSFPRLPLAAYIPGRRGGKARRRLPPASPLPGDQRVRARAPDLPRGRPLRGHPRPAAPRPRRDQRRRRDHRDRQALRRLRLPPPGRRSARTCARTAASAWAAPSTGCCGCRPCSPAAASGSAATRRSAAARASSSRSPTGSRTAAGAPDCIRAEATRRRRHDPGAHLRRGRRRCGSPTWAAGGARTPTSAASGSTCARAAG